MSRMLLREDCVHTCVDDCIGKLHDSPHMQSNSKGLGLHITLMSQVLKMIFWDQQSIAPYKELNNKQAVLPSQLRFNS